MVLLFLASFYIVVTRQMGKMGTLRCLSHAPVVARRVELSLNKTRMWANVQRDGCPAKHNWHPLFNDAVLLTPTT